MKRTHIHDAIASECARVLAIRGPLPAVRVTHELREIFKRDLTVEQTAAYMVRFSKGRIRSSRSGIRVGAYSHKPLIYYLEGQDLRGWNIG